MITPDGKVESDNEHRLCSIATFYEGSEIHGLFADRVNRNLKLLNQRYRFALYDDPLRRFASINILRYRAGESGRFKPHVDLGGQAGVDQRKLTLVVPLNDEFLGGSLQVDVGRQYDAGSEAEIGDAIVFPSFTMHHVPPILAGERYVAVGWLQGPRFR